MSFFPQLALQQPGDGVGKPSHRGDAGHGRAVDPAGGGECALAGAQTGAYGLPFAGGAGAGISIHPMGFLVCSANGVRLLSANCASPMERMVEMIPQALEGLKSLSEEEAREDRKLAHVKAAYEE